MEIELRKRERIIVTCTAAEFSEALEYMQNNGYELSQVQSVSGYEKFNIHGNRDIVESDAISTT